MKGDKKTIGGRHESALTKRALPLPRRMAGLVILILIQVLCADPAHAEWPRMAESADGTSISYEVYGSGEPTLVFVHGWSCDARYWQSQVPHFAASHRVIVLDLAGHGHSGVSRSQYGMKAFGEDVRAVVEAAGGRRAILIGHSMGGWVIAEAARLMPERVIGLIGIDTLENIEYRMTREEREGMTAPFKEDFRSGCRQFVAGMFSQQTDPQLREWVLADMSAAPPAVAISALNELTAGHITGEAATIFDAIRKPVVTVNGDLWPINYEGNRRHMAFFDAIVIKNAGHFLMLDRPVEFNRALEKAIRTVMEKAKPQSAD